MTKNAKCANKWGFVRSLATVKAVLAAIVRGFVLVTILPAEICYSIVNHKGPI